MTSTSWLMSVPLAVATAACGACGGAQTRSAPEAEREAFAPDDDDAATAAALSSESYAAAANAFAMGFWAEVGEAEQGNLIVSPTSVHMALSMVFAGAGGETADQMAAVLGAGDDPSAFHAAVGTMLSRWNDPERDDYELAVANRLFAEQSYTWQEPFLALTGDTYGAPLDPVDFRGAADPARVRINEWVKEATRGRIEDLLPEGSVNSATRMVLTNAVYFLGDWVHPFDVDRTRDRTFYAPAGEREVPMMHQREKLAYAEADGVQVLELPYVGGEFDMVIALPEAKDGLAAVEASLSEGALDEWTEGLTERTIDLAMPRFELEPPEPMKLSDVLIPMGIEDAFAEAEADFSAMADPSENEGTPLFVAEVFHKGFVAVDEEGTEAAAATGAVMETRSAPPEPPDLVEFVADHPFLFFIRDRETGAILFMGRLADPS
jgi:serpin B